MILIKEFIHKDVVLSKMEMSPDITRSGLAVYVCEELSFRDRKGDLQIGSCLKALGELESLGLVSLPVARTGIGKNWSFRRMEGYDLSPVGLPERVDQIRDLSLTLVLSKDEKRMRIHNELILKDHPQGIKRVVGRQVRYLVESEHGYLGAVTFGSSALRLFARDQWIGWNKDQTDLNYTPNKECQGLGPIGTNKNKIEAKGLSLHTCFAFSEEGLPLGILNATCRTPEWPEEKIRKSERRKLPIEQKKTYKWLQSYLDCVAVSQKIPDTRMIAVMDREADIFELYEQVMGTGNKVPVIIRAQHDHDGQAVGRCCIQGSKV